MWYLYYYGNDEKWHMCGFALTRKGIEDAYTANRQLTNGNVDYCISQENLDGKRVE